MNVIDSFKSDSTKLLCTVTGLNCELFWLDSFGKTISHESKIKLISNKNKNYILPSYEQKAEVAIFPTETDSKFTCVGDNANYPATSEEYIIKTNDRSLQSNQAAVLIPISFIFVLSFIVLAVYSRQTKTEKLKSLEDIPD